MPSKGLQDDAALGPFLVEYRTSASGYVKLVLIMLVTLAIAVSFFYLAVTAHENIGGRVVAFVFGLLFSLPAGLVVHGLIRGRDNSLRFYQSGLVVRDSGTERRATWDEIASYDVGAFLMVAKKDGETIEFGMGFLESVDDVAARLREEVVRRRLLPEMIATIGLGAAAYLEGMDPTDAKDTSANGNRYVSGFTLDTDGVTPDGAERIGWSDVTAWGTVMGSTTSGRATVEVTYAYVRGPSGGFQTLFESVRDREALLAVCGEMAPDRQRPLPQT